MAAMILQRNLKNSLERDKALIIEMSEATADVKDAGMKAEAVKPMSYIQSQIQSSNPHQGSVLSLTSARSFIDQSDVQPLTEIHACRYDECVKYHRTKTEEDAPQNPSSPIKNILLYLVIGLFFLWIIIYTVLSQLKLL